MITISDFHALERIVDYMQGVPYDVTPRRLYSAESLYGSDFGEESFSLEQCYDQRTYQHFLRTGKHDCGEQEMLSRTLHDYGMDRALQEFLTHWEKHRVVGVMGGHQLLRTDPMFREIVLMSKELTERGLLMVSGGGPGAMEATHLGAWLAGRTAEEAEAALEMLRPSPLFKDAGWLDAAFRVMRQFPQREFRSLGIPTWLYGHEPATPFATDIAKYFDNSIREDTILTIAFGGIIFTPGSAGTMQEVFQEAVQNHYLSFGFSSPMVFLGRHFWDDEMPVFPFLERMMAEGKYKNLKLLLTDSAHEAVQELLRFQNGEEFK